MRWAEFAIELRTELWALRQAAAQIRAHLRAQRRLAQLHEEAADLAGLL